MKLRLPLIILSDFIFIGITYSYHTKKKTHNELAFLFYTYYFILPFKVRLYYNSCWRDMCVALLQPLVIINELIV